MKKQVSIAVFCNILFGFMPIYWTLLSHVDTGYVLGQRIFWSIPFTFVIVLLEKNLPQLKGAFKNRRTLLLTVLAGLTISCNWYIYMWAVTHSMVLETSMAYYMSPLVVFLLGLLAFHEKCTKWDILAVCFAAAGILISALTLGVFPWLSILLAVTFSVYGALKKAAGLDPAVSLTIEMLTVLPIALIYLCCTSFGPEGHLAGLGVSTLLLLVGTGFISSFPLWLYSQGIRDLPFSLVGFLQFIWPTTSMLLSVFYYKEELSSGKLVCFIFIWIGLIIYMVSKLKKPVPAKEKSE